MSEGPRPPKLYRYAAPESLARSLTLGEFRLRASGDSVTNNSVQIYPFGDGSEQRGAARYLILSLFSVADARHFKENPDAESCLIIHDTENFGERLHRAVQRALPQWTGIDAPVAYGVPSPLGAAFSMDKQWMHQQEWRFAWRPTAARLAVNPLVVQIGSIESIAEIRAKPQGK